MHGISFSPELQEKYAVHSNSDWSMDSTLYYIVMFNVHCSHKFIIIWKHLRLESFAESLLPGDRWFNIEIKKENWFDYTKFYGHCLHNQNSNRPKIWKMVRYRLEQWNIRIVFNNSPSEFGCNILQWIFFNSEKHSFVPFDLCNNDNETIRQSLRWRFFYEHFSFNQFLLSLLPFSTQRCARCAETLVYDAFWIVKHILYFILLVHCWK